MKVRKTEETRPVKVPMVAVYLEEEEARKLARLGTIFSTFEGIDVIRALGEKLREAGY